MASFIPLRHRLQTRMIVSILSLLALLMLITTYMGIQRERRGIFDQMRQDGVALAKSYALSAENAMLLRNPAGLGRVTGEASRTAGIKYMKIVDQRGVIMGHTDVAMIGRQDDDPLCNLALLTPITAVEKGKRPLTEVARAKNGEDIFRVVVPLVILDRVQGALEIGLDMAGITEAVRRTNTQSLIIALSAFCFGGFYIWFFSRSLTRPVKRLVEAAQRVAAGDLTHETDAAGRDEIGRLAAAFNHMTRELKAYTDDLKRTNAQLEADAATIQRLRRYTENILASIRPGVLTTDIEGRITTINRAGAEILGLAGDAPGRLLDEVLSAENPLRILLAESLASGEFCHGREMSLSTSDGREICLLVNTAPLNDQDSRLVGLAATFEDITEIRYLQRLVTEAEKLAAMGQLAVGVAHEVRNPLGAIKTGAQFLEARFAADEPRRKLTQLMIREIDRLNQLVERLLDFARPAPSNMQYEDVNELIERSLALALLKEGDGRLEIVRSYAPDPPRLLVDAKRLHQAFLNVMLNAIDAMPGGGRLTITTALETNKKWFRVEFSDTGEGIAPERLKKIFNPFFSTRRQGTGLGLAIVQQILTEHGGEATVRSTVGEGTTLILRLPLQCDNGAIGALG